MKNMSLREVYSHCVCELAKKDKEVYVLEADLSSSMATNHLKKEIGNQYINMGIMEENMIGVASGISLAGGYSFSHTFAQFLTRRAFDQIFISLGYAKQNACLVGSDAGISAEFNGGTHMPFEDIALMNTIPNCTIYDVSDGYQLQYAIETAYKEKGLTYIRTIRKENSNLYTKETDFSEGIKIFPANHKKKDAVILACGILVTEALKAKEELEKDGVFVEVIDVFRLKPLNEQAIMKQLEDCDNIIVCENHSIHGGLNSIIALMLANNMPKKIKSIAVDNYGQVGTLSYLKDVYQLGWKDIVKKYYE